MTQVQINTVSKNTKSVELQKYNDLRYHDKNVMNGVEAGKKAHAIVNLPKIAAIDACQDVAGITALAGNRVQGAQTTWTNIATTTTPTTRVRIHQ